MKTENVAEMVDGAEVKQIPLPDSIDVRLERKALRRYLRGQLNAEFKANFRYFLPAWLARTKAGELGYDVRVHVAVTMPESVVEEIQRAGQAAAAEELLAGMTPDERLRFAAESAPEPFAPSDSARPIHRDPVDRTHDVHTCSRCADASCLHPDAKEHHGN